ncbi:unnamed protein product, partial [Rotaria sp. Silwood1]
MHNYSTKGSLKKLSINNQEESYLFAQKQLNFLSEHSIIQGNLQETMTNILELDFLFEQIAFWYKKNNYYIVETDFDTCDNVDLNDVEFVKYQEIFSSEKENELDDTMLSFNEKVPPEQFDYSVDQKVFHVSTGINQPFVQLPMVTPEQIELSRRIQRFFTDDLEAPVICEINFPVNDDEEEEEEEDMDEETMNLHQIKFDINTNFEGNRLEDLALSHGQYWVH